MCARNLVCAYPATGPDWSTCSNEIGRAHVELQSLRHLVCRLLLEKKKKIKHEPVTLAWIDSVLIPRDRLHDADQRLANDHYAVVHDLTKHKLTHSDGNGADSHVVD